MRFLLFFFCIIGLFAQETSMFPQDSDAYTQPMQNQNSPQGFLPATPAPIEKESSLNTPLVQEKDLKNPFEKSPPQEDLIPLENSDSNQAPNSIQENYQGTLTPKNVYLSLVSPLQNVLYVKQIIPIEVKLLIFGEYSKITTNFIAKDSSVSVLNPEENWILNQDSSLRNTFYFRIEQVNFTIPKIEAIIQTSEGVLRESAETIVGKAVPLERKGSYSQVVANDLRIVDTKITSYDSQSNLAVFQLQSTMGNLFDFHLETYAQQGIESKKGDYKESEIFYYAVVPKSLDKISFDYFNVQSAKYVELHIDNFSQDDRVSTQSDIRPKNTLQIYKILATIFLIIVFLGLYLYYRKKLFLVLGAIVLAVLIYLLSIKTSATLKTDVEIRIQPTFNSTIILTTQNPMEVKILSDKYGYYKILLEDDRIGWVRKDGIQN